MCMSTIAEAMQGHLTIIRRRRWLLQNLQPSPTSSACTMVRQQNRRVCNIIKLVRCNGG